MPSATELLGEGGAFARNLDGFRCRAAQLEFTAAIEKALADGDDLVAEAGTGVGKTFAYLVPLYAREAKAVISTGTKNLQGQLYHRDLPTVQRILGIRRKLALLKGRANYVCIYRLQRARADAERKQAGVARVLRDVESWAESDRTGELADIPFPWPQEVSAEISSTAENCLGQECPSYRECFVLRARQKAQQADIVVVNHHLLFADLGLKRDGFGELLPKTDVIIVDEAHKAPDIATEFFGTRVSSRLLGDLQRDTLKEAGEAVGALNTVLPVCQSLETRLKQVRLLLGEANRRAGWTQEMAARIHVDGLYDVLDDFMRVLETLSAMSPGLESCWIRSVEALQRLDAFMNPRSDQIPWFETLGRGFSFNLSPLEVAEEMRGCRASLGSHWIFTSATLSASGNFDLFIRRLGLDEPMTMTVGSPFDYASQARLFVPQIPWPSTPDHLPSLLRCVDPLLEKNAGRAFLLFTSHRNLQLAAAALRRQGRWKLFIQGEAPRERLLQEFRSSENAILLGAASFWEGVDVVGEGLSLVVIDKLPFASPDDPVLKSRIEKLREEGGDPFSTEQLPQAILTLKQGVGRLIRSESDFGVLVIGDRRILERGYGARFLKSLPPIPLVTELDDVLAFYDDKRSGVLR